MIRIIWKQTNISHIRIFSLFLDSQSIDRSSQSGLINTYILTSIHRHNQNIQGGEKLKHTHTYTYGWQHLYLYLQINLCEKETDDEVLHQTGNQHSVD